jgi:N-methylhydantoinase B
MHISQTMLRGMPVEMFESKAPIRIRRTELRADSGGAGKYRGGLGIRRDYELLKGLRALAINKKTRYPSWPLAGGKSGARNGVRLSFDGKWSDRVTILANNNDLYHDADDRIVWTGMMHGEFEPGEVISNRSGGGGGYGDPFERPPEQVREDVRDGYVSKEAAREDYGVSIADDGQINREKTARLRD